MALVADLALREKQIQQTYRPVIGVHKWFARRPGTLFRALLLAEFGRGELAETFFQPNDIGGICVADPFMGGGTPLMEANRLGCDVVGFDVNPMATWIVREEIDHIDLEAYGRAASLLMASLDGQVGQYYRTRCPIYGDEDVPVKSFLWVKVLPCSMCGAPIDLFPGYVVAKNARHPNNVVLCANCGELNEVVDTGHMGDCVACGSQLRTKGPARRGRCACGTCGNINIYPGNQELPLEHRLFAIEYHNPARKGCHRGRFFKKPDEDDLGRVASATHDYDFLDPRFVPDDPIPPGDETSRLLRWGYSRYCDLFNPRQLVGLELSCRAITAVEDDRVRRALATNLSDLLRYQNMLCRYDTMALKALDVFSIHGFPVGLVQCESNLLGITNAGGTCVGSGGWSNIVRKYVKAKSYCNAPYEVRREGKRRRRVPTIPEEIRVGPGSTRRVSIRCISGTQSDFAPASIDAVLTDPPYYGNIQYAELMDFCYMWLRRLVGPKADGFAQETTRSPQELTGNQTAARGIEEFAEGLATVYRRMATALKPGAPLAFTYHHNKVEAYAAAGVAMLDAKLACTASLPCPAEMSGSIHIHGTQSSIMDTVFVCRASNTGEVHCVEGDEPGLLTTLDRDIEALAATGREPKRGDVRCVLLGHLTRAAVWELGDTWDAARPTDAKLEAVSDEIRRFGDVDGLVATAMSRRQGTEAETGRDALPV